MTGSNLSKVLAIALLVLAIAFAGAVARAQNGMGASSGHDERVAANEKRRRQAQAEERRRRQQSAAHAVMPDTMYASTPSGENPPHPFLADAPEEPKLERSAQKQGSVPRGTAGPTYGVPLLVAASDPWRQGMVRIINHSSRAGTVRIDAYDDAGEHHGPLTLHLEADASVHFSSTDLERGNPDAGLDGATGAPGTGHWRLALASDLDIEALAYLRTGDGFLASLHDLVTPTGSGHRVALFHPGGSADQGGRLRLINPGTESTEVTIEGIDDEGRSPGGAVRLSLDPGATRTLHARALESGNAVDLSGALGDGSGRWRLAVSSERPIDVMSLLASPTGHLSNLSTNR